MSLEERTATLEKAFATLVRLSQDLDERLDTQLSWINQLGEAQANSEAKIAALADAQIRTEDALTRLSEAQSRTEGSVARIISVMEGLTVRMSELAAMQSHTDQRLDALIDIIRERSGGQS